MKAESHSRQAERLSALYEYEILDTARESDFDDIVKVVSKLCDAPIAVINLIDMHRQWFKAEVGLGVRETPLETSICSHAILESDFVEIPDTRLDSRTRDNELCSADSGLRYYAGALLKTDEGLPIGTLCVLDYEPRELTPLQKEVVQVFAAQVMKQLDLRLALKREIETAAIVQERTVKLDQALEDQKIISREIDHRVKNSLQIISSLLRIQMQKATSPETVAALSVTEGRVDAIAMLHQELHQAGHFDTVNLQHLVDNIVRLLDRSCPAGISLRTDLAPVRANALKATAVAVIVNEFVTNSMKYAFPAGGAGEVLLSGAMLESGQYRMVLSDDGAGLPPASDIGAAEGLGMMIMEASASRLGTQLDLSPRGKGTRLEFVFAPD